MKDLKYLIAYVPMLFVYLGIYWGGWWTYSGLIIAFVMIPTVELFYAGNSSNEHTVNESVRLSNRFFDFLLYINLPLLFGLIFYYFYTLKYSGFETYELVGMTLSVGIINGTAGINVAHELGHRKTKFEQVLSQILLLPSFYMHFFIEHNLGHHKNVATEKDPASSRFGENIYAFFFRSVIFGYLSAWKIENQIQKRNNKPILNLSNRMVIYTIVQLAYVALIIVLFDPRMILPAIWIGIISFLLLESVNYIEHYGLSRNQLENGRYEAVQPHHSWNSNHALGRIILYELTRHSDHHFKASRKYQILRHFDESPQLPLGYPGSILLALVPPLWFWVMNKKVKQYYKAVA